MAIFENCRREEKRDEVDVEVQSDKDMARDAFIHH